MKTHWTHRLRIRKLFTDGFTIEELTIMYNISVGRVNNIVQGLKKPERL